MASSSVKRMGAVLGAVVAVAVSSGCEKNFAGPYPCITDYASCTTSDRCETNTASDPEHCGKCGQTCPQGATCTDGECSDAPRSLDSNVQPSTFAINTDNLYWSINSNPNIRGMSKSTEVPFQVDVPDANQSGSGGPFAVDDSELFYFAQSNLGSGSVVRLQAVPALPGVAEPPRILFEVDQQGFPNPTSMVATADYLYAGGNAGNSLGVLAIAKHGASQPVPITFPSANAGTFAVDSTNVYAVATMGLCTIQSAPATGGKVKTLVGENLHGCAEAMASDDQDLYWAMVYPEPTDSNDDNGNTGFRRCLMEVASVPVGGGPVTTRATFATGERPIRMVVQGGDAYLATDRSVWRIPAGHGAPARVAGNLGAASRDQGGNGFNGDCSYNGSDFGPGGSIPVSVAVDASDVYVVAIKFGETNGRLFRIPK